MDVNRLSNCIRLPLFSAHRDVCSMLCQQKPKMPANRGGGQKCFAGMPAKFLCSLFPKLLFIKITLLFRIYTSNAVDWWCFQPQQTPTTHRTRNAGKQGGGRGFLVACRQFSIIPSSLRLRLSDCLIP